MPEVIGFEGGSYDDTPLNYGAAAIRDGDRLWNAVTKFEGPFEKWAEFVEDKVVTVCPPHTISMEILELEDYACFVLRSMRQGPVFDILTEQLKEQSLASWSDERWSFWLFANFDTLTAFGKRVAPMVLKLAETHMDAESLKHQAYVLDHTLDPNFQAMMAGVR